MKKQTVRNCDGCSARLNPARTMVLGIGEPEVIHYVCFPCALKLSEGDKALDARATATASKRAHGVLAA